MSTSPAHPEGSVLLRFGGEGISDDQVKALLGGLSASVVVGPHLFTATDELPAIERLTVQEDGSYGAHRTFPLAELIDLPGDGEVDVEGIAWEPPYLWVVGSHSRRRAKPEGDADAGGGSRDLADVDDDSSRALLARFPLNDAGDGLQPLAACLDPADTSRELTAARLKGRGRRAGLLRLLKKDPHLADSLRWPGKDNGFDVEGLAACGGRVMAGLRGPVLRGWAVILELQLEDGKRPGRLRARRIGPGRERYRKHLVHLDGLGIRDLAADGNDLLILAGPTADVAGPASIFRWRGGAVPGEPMLLQPGEAERILDLPVDPHCDQDHPEGMALLPGGRVMITYDAVPPGRTDGSAVRAERFTLPR